MIYPLVRKVLKGKSTICMKTPKNGQPELCGCGTAAEIAYLGHNKYVVLNFS